MSGEFIAEMAWKSALISAAALIAFLVVRSRAASDKAAVLRLAVALLLVLPPVSLAMPAFQVEQPAALEHLPIRTAPGTPPPAFVATSETPERTASAEGGMAHSLAIAAPTGPDLLTSAYLVGLLLFGLRLLGGLWTLRRWTRAAVPVTCPRWLAAFDAAGTAAGVTGRLRLLASPDVPGPLSWGLRRPVILIDRDSLSRVDDADAILAHEIAHVTRGDWPALMLSRVAVILFWFNPLVWLLERALIQEAEEAADLEAVGRLEPVRYAESLVTCFRHAGRMPAPANSIAPGRGLSRRVAAILDGGRRNMPPGSMRAGVAMAVCVALAVPVAALKLIPPAAEPMPVPPQPFASAAAPDLPAPPVIPAARVSPDAPLAPEPPDAVLPAEAPEIVVIAQAPEPPRPPETPRAPAAPPMPPVPPVPPVPPIPPSTRATAVAVASASAQAAAAVSAASEAVIDVDTLIALHTHGVDADYIEQIAAIGQRYRALSARELTRMRALGISAAYIRSLADAGYDGLTSKQLVRMRALGVDADLARRARAGGARPTPEQLIKIRILNRM
ncbi:MAG: hypothetical protein AVDCRST_MAG91-3381 [uncultured Sphingomonadaceae bacterium]|uniref:Peptidase M56 domain-containing protein n=1 Tax=uncultured Sphingomonadaceae bacterium TaxID=169976 RepID=A0A6J4TYF4_9SPHN|nr:MAG: hypothetical protein AVDCRST_MAG91-3381 [uncultured Sphingomonadaceae bacterium]